MKKIAAVFVVVVLVLSGCNLFKKPPQEAVSGGLKKFAEVQKSSSALTLRGTVNATSGTDPMKIQFAFEALGASDMSDLKSPEFDTAVKFEVSLADKKYSGDAQFRSVDQKIFVKLNSLSLPGEQGTAVQTQLASLLNVWWMLPSSDTPFGKLSEQQKELKEKFKTITFFKTAQEDGAEDVRGVPSIRYRVELDKDALKEFILAVAALEGNQVSPQEESAFADALKDVEFAGAVWIGDDDILHRVQGTITAAPKEGPTSSFDVDYTTWNFGEDVAIAVPEGAREFSPLMMIPLMGALGGLTQEPLATPDESATGNMPVPPDLGAEQLKMPVEKTAQ